MPKAKKTAPLSLSLRTVKRNRPILKKLWRWDHTEVMARRPDGKAAYWQPTFTKN